MRLCLNTRTQETLTVPTFYQHITCPKKGNCKTPFKKVKDALDVTDWDMFRLHGRQQFTKPSPCHFPTRRHWVPRAGKRPETRPSSLCCGQGSASAPWVITQRQWRRVSLKKSFIQDKVSGIFAGSKATYPELVWPRLTWWPFLYTTCCVASTLQHWFVTLTDTW